MSSSVGRYMAYSPSPSSSTTAPHSPHFSGIRSATTALVEQEKYLSELLAERQKLNPFMPILPNCCRLLNQGQFPTTLANFILLRGAVFA
ncbi:hypothetical protein C5167_009664 [Papaver somniferum]|uniref:STAR protein homodimerisation region domain-containing protein n=1 Tax=Papaver somniferum TaxID=3469 RepID=A0A4Y7JY27_PAPSO|nr:hypothetical protein C5167_009664 [Papaver somniferum]